MPYKLNLFLVNVLKIFNFQFLLLIFNAMFPGSIIMLLQYINHSNMQKYEEEYLK